MTLKSPRNLYAPSVNFNRVIRKQRRRRIISKIYRSALNVDTLNRLPLQIITNDPSAVQLFFGSSFR
jgi:hypothetical protein